MNKEQTCLADARYESPSIEVIEIKVEQGFASSIEGFEEIEEDW